MRMLLKNDITLTVRCSRGDCMPSKLCVNAITGHQQIKWSLLKEVCFKINYY